MIAMRRAAVGHRLLDGSGSPLCRQREKPVLKITKNSQTERTGEPDDKRNFGQIVAFEINAAYGREGGAIVNVRFCRSPE